MSSAVNTTAKIQNVVCTYPAERSLIATLLGIKS